MKYFHTEVSRSSNTTGQVHPQPQNITMTQWVVIQSSAVRHISDTNTDPLIRGVNQSWLSHRHIVRKSLWFYTQFQGTAHSWANCQSDSKDLLGIVLFLFFFLRSDPFTKVIMYFSSTVIPERRGIFLFPVLRPIILPMCSVAEG